MPPGYGPLPRGHEPGSEQRHNVAAPDEGKLGSTWTAQIISKILTFHSPVDAMRLRWLALCGTTADQGSGCESYEGSARHERIFKAFESYIRLRCGCNRFDQDGRR